MATILGKLADLNEKEIIYLVCTALNITAIVVALLLQCLKAEYGRYFDGKSESKWGVGMNPKLAWFLQELPMFALPLMFLVKSFNGVNPNTVLLCFLLIHYFRRVFLYPLQMKGGKLTPWIIWLFALSYTSINGYTLGRYLSAFASYDKSWFYDTRFLVGSCLFFTGLLLNIQSDYILTNLRKPGETGYKIPRGGLFEYVSGANFFTEILEWTGFAIACWNYPAFTYAFFTWCNIGPRACQHHRFYLEKFEDYPKSRKALIPFLF